MPRPLAGPPSRWDIVCLTIGAGILVGLQVGKVPPAIPLLRADLGLSLVEAGWVASLFNVAGAAGGVAAGAFADRAGALRVLLACLAALAAGSLLGSQAGDGGVLLASRALESLGFVGITVSGPRLIVAAATPADQGLALGVWSSYMPAGMALAMFLAPAVLSAGGWRALWWGNAVLVMAFLLLAAWATRPRRWPAAPAPLAASSRRLSGAAVLRPGPWLLAGCFALYTVQWLALTTWLPTVLIDTLGYSTAGAAFWGAVVVAANICGTLGAGWALHRGWPRSLLLCIAWLAMLAGGLPVFIEAWPAAWKLPLAVLFSVGGGLLPGAVLAGAAVHAPAPGQVGTVAGVIVQGANAGSLLGPPLLAALAVQFGWVSGGGLLVGCSVAGFALTLLLARAERRLAAGTGTASSR